MLGYTPVWEGRSARRFDPPRDYTALDADRTPLGIIERGRLDELSAALLEHHLLKPAFYLAEVLAFLLERAAELVCRIGHAKTLR